MHNFRDVLRFFCHQVRRRLWPLRRPPWPENRDGRVYVHIGAGPLRDDRFINVDIQPFRSIHFLSNGMRIPLSSSSSDLVYASHVLEHFPHRETAAVLTEWFRILRPGGELFLAVPDFSRVCQVYIDQKEMEAIRSFVMGSQGNPFDFHYNIFDDPSIAALLRQVGFEDILPWEARDFTDYPFDDYAHYGPTREISLTVKARKPPLSSRD